MFPLGVTTAEVLVGRASSFQGTRATINVTVTPILNGNVTHLVHYATGYILGRLKDSYRGDEVSFRVPHADQTGFRDESQKAATGWHYRADVTVISPSGDSFSYSKEFQPLVGTDVIDLDLLAGGPTLAPSTVTVPPVTSVNGLTGNVVVSGDTALLSSLPFSRAALEHRVRVSEMRRYRGRRGVRKKAAVTVIMDHGLNKFDASVRPLLTARNLPVTLALNSNWQDTTDARHSTNNLVTPAMVKAWVDAGWLEPANHGRTHSGYTTDEQMTTEIVTGREELETMLGHRVDSWVQPSMTTGDGFNSGGDQTMYWSTHTGRTILRSHAVVSGLAPGSSLYALDGEPTIGMKGGWIDTSTTDVETAIQNAINSGTGYIVRFHPQFLDQTGYLTTAQLTSFLDRLVAWRDGGDIDVLQFRDFAVAKREPADQDTGVRNVHSLFAATPTGGVIYLRRSGSDVELNIYGVGFTGLGTNPTLYKLPVGFQPDYHRVFAEASFKSAGPRFLIHGTNGGANAGNIVSLGNTDGTFYVSFNWKTRDAFPVPANYPGTAG